MMGNNKQKDVSKELLKILKGNTNKKKLQTKLSKYHENDIALTLDKLSFKEQEKFFLACEASFIASVLEYSENINAYLKNIPLNKRVEILQCFSGDVINEYLLKEDEKNRLIIYKELNTDIKKEIALYSTFELDEIASKMSTNYIKIKEGTSIKQAMRLLVKEAHENDNIQTIYMVDENDCLIGAIDLKDLIIARADTDIKDILVTSYPFVFADELIEDCIEKIRSYSEDSIPVLNKENQLIGVIIAEDFVDILEEEMSEDYAKLAGLSSQEDLHEPIYVSLKKRLPWLIVLLVLGLFVSSVVGVFEHVVAELTLIVCFQSLILGMAGNSGTQSLAVTIRVLMDENLSGKQKAFLVSKEARIGLLNGMILGLLSFLIVGLYIAWIKGYTYQYAFSVSMCTGIALMCSIFLASVVGTCIPLLFKKIKIDPAVASGPLITTLNDLLGVISYYSLAWFLLINVLGL